MNNRVLVLILASFVGIVLAQTKPALAVVDPGQGENVRVIVTVGSPGSAPPPPTPGANTNPAVAVVGQRVQYMTMSTRQILMSGVAGSSVTVNCGVAVTIKKSAGIWEPEAGFMSDFHDYARGLSFPSDRVYVSSQIDGRFILADYLYNGGSFLVLGYPPGGYPYTNCVGVRVRIPAGTPPGVYESEIAFNLLCDPNACGPGTGPIATPTPTPTPTPTATPIGPLLYSAPSIGAQHQFYAYPLTGNGNVAPLFDVESASQNIGNPPYFSNPTDARTLPNGNILISAEGPDQLFVIAPITASGTMTVVGTITNSLFDVPTAVGTDSAGNYYVLQGNSNFWGTAAIMKFPAGANGNVAAVSQIPSNTNGVATSTGILSNPNDIAVRADGTIYATSWAGGSAFVGEVLAFASNANGPSATPIATIAGSNTNIGANPGYVALDGQGKIYVLTRDDGGDGWPGSGSSAGFVAPLNVRIVVYAANANGNVAPTATIEGSNTKLAFPTKMRVDSSGGIYVADTGVGGILYFPPGSNGNVAPTREIFGPSTVFGINDIQFVDL